ncbi:RNA polymerase sigma-70 factor [Flavobacteriaceae bacterium F08102]|nr:RNA polymerase sigma-70 factor [Flavobacteriaceae bacterium F08102]
MKPVYIHNDQLIDQLKAGREEAYAYLVDRYHHKLYVYANNLINDDLMAEDIVQNVFINLWKRRKKLKIRISLERLLYKSVYNEFIDQYRKKTTILRVEKQYYEHFNALLNEYDEDALEKAVKLVYATVQELPVKCKEIFLLSKSEGLTNAEIAKHLGISIKTVEGQISSAYRHIKATIGDKINVMLFLLFDMIKGKENSTIHRR